MNSNDRNQCLHMFLNAGYDLTNSYFPNEDIREKFIETAWKLILDGNLLGIPGNETIHELIDSMKEVDELGRAAYAQKYGLRLDESGNLIDV